MEADQACALIDQADHRLGRTLDEADDVGADALADVGPDAFLLEQLPALVLEVRVAPTVVGPIPGDVEVPLRVGRLTSAIDESMTSLYLSAISPYG